MPDPIDSPRSKTPEYERPRSQNAPKPRPASGTNSWFALPAPLKYLFSRFPLQTLPPSQLPIRTAPYRDQHTLYIFTTASAATRNGPSFNPTCLKWQTYLKFLGVDFQTIASTNHASPTGVLPFLIPATGSEVGSSEDVSQKGVVVSNRLQKWAKEKGLGREEPESMRYEAYMALLDHLIRRAWVCFIATSPISLFFVLPVSMRELPSACTDTAQLYHLYLTPNFDQLAASLYIDPSTRSLPVRLALSRSLQAAALAELLITSPTISAEALYKDAETAMAALSALLGDDTWFFGTQKPGLFDASVFAYTYPLFGGLEWAEKGLQERLRRCENLIRHREGIVGKYFPDGGAI